MSEIIEIKAKLGKERILEIMMMVGRNCISCSDRNYGIPSMNYIFYKESSTEQLIDTMDEMLKPSIRVVPTEYFIIYTNEEKEFWGKYMEVFQQIKNKYQYVDYFVLMHK